MAFYLLTPPTTALTRVQLATDISQTVSGSFEIEFEVDIFGSNGIVAADSTGNGQNLIFFTTRTNLQLRIANSQRNFALPQSADGRHVYRIVSSTLTGNIQVFQDGVLCGTTGGNNFFAISRITDLNNQTARHFGLYNFKVRGSSGEIIHNYDPSASNGAGTTLIDTINGNNGTLINFPLDPWVFYDDSGSETNEQILSATGTLSSVASGTAATQIINEQSLNTSGSVSSAASGTAATTAINEQVLTAIGQVSVTAAGAAQLSAVNEQQSAITGSLQTQSAALAQLNSINEQNLTVTGSASAVMAGFAQVQAVNELAGEQIGFISGALQAFNAGVSVVQGINDQHSNVAGTAVLSSVADALAIAVNEQNLALTGSAQVSSYAFAALQSVNEQAGEQIGSIGGQIIAASIGQAVVSVINDQQRSISGTIIVASTGRARLQKINQGNIVLAPERMSARRITENLSATHIKHNITAYRV